ncbi:hypothetical protein BDFB_000773 [Asbolus verrucosus]|uniref:C2H2-type domain-containing protein n=1 Tax=Asbolus verrucosus TaxID=1661398 RepID=A0A482VSV6_ASBVE|nr:hypothetical protein BDFB_000773 [Asbolus verrucosus]
MSYFQNTCRLCPKTFCCKDCRAHHEEQFHNVNPECEICIYGRMTIKNASVLLLNHIKAAHWPLHCVTENNEPSPMITPFYKSNDPTTQQIHSAMSMAVTSTPLVHKEEYDVNQDKITPINSSEIKYQYKSSLKLTGSSNLSDSKKSDRRVTFCETPSVNEPFRKFKHLPLEHISIIDGDEVYKTVSTPGTFNEEKENIDNRLSLCTKADSNATMWESALTNFGSGALNNAELADNATNNFNLSLEINVFKSDASSELGDASLNKSTSLWSSMTNIMKSVMNNISFTAHSSFCKIKKK